MYVCTAGSSSNELILLKAAESLKLSVMYLLSRGKGKLRREKEKEFAILCPFSDKTRQRMDATLAT